jgi:AraC-like DNA-binding protein
MTSPRRSRTLAPQPIRPVGYTPPGDYAHDVELYPVEELRRRAQRFDALGIERIEFHCLIWVTSGRYRHMVDFDSFDCGPGSMLTIQPGQVHRFGALTGWTGWLLIFRPEAVRPLPGDASTGELESYRRLAELPTHLPTSGATRRAVSAAFEQMASDARLAAPGALVNQLLRRQVESLLIRLQLAQPGADAGRALDAVVLERYRRYKAMVEREYRRWHGVGPYASRLGCSEKSLGRATRAVVDASAKSLLVDRIVLEAKRLLAHTALPVAAIAADLGFEEATNFVKFFRRETGVTPGGFRGRQRSAPPAGPAAQARATRKR